MQVYRINKCSVEKLKIVNPLQLINTEMMKRTCLGSHFRSKFVLLRLKSKNEKTDLLGFYINSGQTKVLRIDPFRTHILIFSSPIC